METSEMVALLGKPAEYAIDGMKINVTIVDVRKVYNRTDYKITPESGSGTKWVDARKVRF